ncbi:uncharacterized protein NPIL_684911 [Nephila pilipes]|uniref:Uncharacterized protein n=1 Tax=Nephila pilipes TaxID=299642 RepID=A0A8X6TW38_NEPPI|nr:uncharacterized protein NPIL_684911 [Nephila pilipes]
MEELPSLKSSLSEEEEFCETHFKATYKINDQGRFVVKLPIYRDINQLVDTKGLAISRLLAMENKFKLDSEYGKEYKDFMNEYEEAGHMLRNKSFNYFKKEYFLPNHAVQKKDNITTKLIVIFDGSFKPPNSNSLNSVSGNLWLLKLDWYNTITKHFGISWHKFQRECQQICHISIPRWLQLTEKEITLRGFSDASEFTYACVIYAVQRNDNDVTKLTILAAKSKVAPLKPISIPRLELNGVLLLTRLFSVLINTLKNHVINFYACTDSQVVLSWLFSPPRNWKPFLSNRTSEILDRIPQNR